MKKRIIVCLKMSKNHFYYLKDLLCKYAGITKIEYKSKRCSPKFTNLHILYIQ